MARSLGRALRVLTMGAVPAALLMAGCAGGAGAGTGGGPGGTLTVSPGTPAIDTNCTGCNSSTTSGGVVEQFSASVNGSAASVNWTAIGGDASAGAGTITSKGQYTPPSYLTADSVTVTVTATLNSNANESASTTLTITPGFLQPLAPENAALGANGTATITGYIAESGGTDGINFALANSATGTSGGQGTLGTPNCVRIEGAFTNCTVTYTAPGTITATSATYVVATVGSSTVSKTAAEILLNTAGVNSNPTAHQGGLQTPISLGSSGGNNDDYDTVTENGQIYVTDCCGGTLGSLIQNASGTQYLLSCNHVLARSDQAKVGETIIQPGLIDDNCYPYEDGGSETPVGVLSGFVQLSTTSNNVDAAIAQVNSNAVSASGNILELGAKQADGTLAAAPPGISSTGGKGETGTLNMSVAKSGRTTGLTCAAISAVDMSVSVSYFTNCGETDPYITKTYTNQIVITGDQFSDAGDSGSLVVDASDAEPVGLFFAGGVSDGVSIGVANPVAEVLSELGTQMGTTYTFVGTTDHAVSCLNYGDATVTAAQGWTLSPDQVTRAEQALGAGRGLVNPAAGILGVATGKSSDRAGEAALVVYVDQGMNVAVPQTVNGVRTMVIPTTAAAVEAGMAPLTPGPAALPAVALNQAMSVKQQIAGGLMKKNSAFFGVGVGQSLDNPKEAALVIFVDRREVPATLPATMNGLRVRYVIMDRLHVTRSYAAGFPAHSRCMSHAARQADGDDPFRLRRLPELKIY